jgi:transaldolase
MKQVSGSHESVAQMLSPEKAKGAGVKLLEVDEKKFQHLVNEDAMARGETAEGIRKFRSCEAREIHRQQDQLRNEFESVGM